MPMDGKYTVFEVANDDLREFYVGATSRPFQELIASFARAMPKPVAHWKHEHKLNFRSVEFGLSKECSEAFLANYVRTLSRVGWRVITKASAGRRERA